MKIKRLISIAALVSVPLIAVFTALNRSFRWDVAAAATAVLSCVPMFLSFEKRSVSARELVLISVMTAFSVAGRFVFAAIPFFKPVTALVVLTAMYFGEQAGFMVGAMSALISNIYFGQGAWTPFQMFCWGFLGFLAGLLNKKKLLENPIALCVYGVFSGAAFSVVMDVWTTLSADGTLTAARLWASVLAALPITAAYCVSNVIFLMLLQKPVGKRLERLKTKYGIFGERSEGFQQKQV